MENETEPLLPVKREEHQIVTPYRWVILVIFSLFALLQGTVWNTWGPISASATIVTGFTDHDYDLLINWVTIGVMVTMPFFVWLLNNRGPRIPLIIAIVLITAGTGIRCIPISGVPLKYIIHAGQILNGVAYCMASGSSPLLSNMWFKPSERILATSCILCAANFGPALSYVIGPAVVERPVSCATEGNMSWHPEIVSNSSITTVSQSTGCIENTEEMRKQIDYYLYGEFEFAFILCIVVILFFRNKPPSPPSVSAATEGLDILAGLKKLSKNFSYWATVVSFALVIGAYFGWIGIITVALRGKVNELEVARVAFVMTLIGVAAGIIVGWFADRVKGRVKWILFCCYCVMFISLLYFVIAADGWIDALQLTNVTFWATFILFGSTAIIVEPLAMEMSADIAYPVNEGTSASIVTWCIMLAMFIFLIILNSVNAQFISNYLMLIFIGIATPVLAIFTGNHSVRLNVDDTVRDNESTESQD